MNQTVHCSDVVKCDSTVKMLERVRASRALRLEVSLTSEQSGKTALRNRPGGLGRQANKEATGKGQTEALRVAQGGLCLCTDAFSHLYVAMGAHMVVKFRARGPWSTTLPVIGVL